MVLILNLSNNLGGGGLQVALSVLEECKKIDIHDYHVFFGSNVQKQINVNSFPDNFMFYKIPSVKVWQLYKHLEPLGKRIKPDCVFTIFGPSYWKPRACHVMGFARVYDIYRDFEFIKKKPILFKIKLFIRGVLWIYLFKYCANILIVETEDARQRLMKRLHTSKISVVSNTCSSVYYNYINFPDKLPKRKDNEIRLITISAYYPHKNLESIPKVLEELGKQDIITINFVLTIKSDDYVKLIPERWRSRVYNIGPVSVAECPSLYQECDILYLPTLLEIFSVSYLEAMVMGKPILTSYLSFARDVCGDAALYFDPFNISDIVEAIKKAAFDKNVYQEYADRGRERCKLFPTAAQRAEQYLDICEKLVNKE
jgi:glycosyltransferase involved in cell wall biosynthesis